MYRMVLKNDKNLSWFGDLMTVDKTVLSFFYFTKLIFVYLQSRDESSLRMLYLLNHGLCLPVGYLLTLSNRS